MPARERRKGHNFEREIARRLRERWPEAKRGFQTRGGTKEAADVVGVPLRVECKHGKRPNLPAALRQAETAPGEYPAVAICRFDGGEEFVVMRWSLFESLLGALS